MKTEQRIAYINNGGGITPTISQYVVVKTTWHSDALDAPMERIEFKKRVLDDFMTAIFKSAEDDKKIEVKLSYQKHNDMLYELNKNGCFQTNVNGTVMFFIKRNYEGSVQRATGWTLVSEPPKIDWSKDERSNTLKLLNSGK